MKVASMSSSAPIAASIDPNNPSSGGGVDYKYGGETSDPNIPVGAKRGLNIWD